MYVNISEKSIKAFRNSGIDFETKTIASEVRRDFASRVDHLSEIELFELVKQARKKAKYFQIKHKLHVKQFVLLAILHIPYFWEQELFHQVLTQPSGSGDHHFEDLKALIRLAIQRDGGIKPEWLE